MKIKYLWNKLIKKLPGSAIASSVIPKQSKVEARSTVINTDMGIYSYVGYNCTVLNCSVGNFCSIADGVLIGLGNHPINWVSTSPAFYYGRDSIPKDLASKEFKHEEKRTIIGNDVWIGARATIKEGVTIGDGAIIGMGSIVTKDIPAYAIAVGNPAKPIGYRFEKDIRDRLLSSKWWELPLDVLKKNADNIDNVELFLEELEIND